MNMKILSLYPYSINQKHTETVRFGAASDISLEYVLKKHSKLLPKRMIEKIKEAIALGQKQKPLYELHNEVYKDLFEAESIETLKSEYPEFSDIKDIVSLEKNRSKAIKAVQKIMPLKDFTLDYIKRLYRPTPQDSLVQEYGFSNRSLIQWLNKKLNIKKLNGNYLQLLKMSNEEENSRIAELARHAIFSNTEAQEYRLKKAAEAHKTPEYRTKKKQEMKDYYIRHPETARKTGLISKLTWDRCPEIKEAFGRYTRKLSPYVKKVLSKKQTGAPLTEQEKRTTSGYYKGFWEENEHLRPIYQKRRLEVIEELNAKNSETFD